MWKPFFCCKIPSGRTALSQNVLSKSSSYWVSSRHCQLVLLAASWEDTCRKMMLRHLTSESWIVHRKIQSWVTLLVKSMSMGRAGRGADKIKSRMYSWQASPLTTPPVSSCSCGKGTVTKWQTMEMCCFLVLEAWRLKASWAWSHIPRKPRGSSSSCSSFWQLAIHLWCSLACWCVLSSHGLTSSSLGNLKHLCLSLHTAIAPEDYSCSGLGIHLPLVWPHFNLIIFSPILFFP